MIRTLLSASSLIVILLHFATMGGNADNNLTLAFLDSDPQDLEDTGAHGNERHTCRPWALYWPPSPGDALYSWLQVEHPDALSWRWDPSQPFDRPWQKWSQDARQSGRHSPSIVIPATGLRPVLSRDYNNDLSLGEAKNDQQRAMASLLDKNIHEWCLKAVTPEAFHYLASNQTDGVEKLYHSRLAFLDGVPRTNVVGQAYDTVKIHDVTGSEDKFNLSDSGFQFQAIPVPITTWDTHAARETYLPFMESWMKDYFSSKDVYIYTYNVSLYFF